MLAQVQVPKSHFGQLPALSLPSLPSLPPKMVVPMIDIAQAALVSVLYWTLLRPVPKDPKFTKMVTSISAARHASHTGEEHQTEETNYAGSLLCMVLLFPGQYGIEMQSLASVIF